MKVLIVNTTPFGPGGITTVVLSYYKNMNSNIEFEIVAINAKMPEIYATVFKNGKSNVYCLQRRKNIFTYAMGLYKLCKKNKYDVIHVHGNSGTMIIEMLIACICGVPKRIAHCHTTQHGNKLVATILNFLLRRTYTDAYACSNDAGSWIFKEDYRVLKNAIDLQMFAFTKENREQIRKKFNIKEGDILLGHVGYFNDSKNQKYLVDLLKEIKPQKNIKLFLVGDGKTRKSLERKADNTRVIFCGSSNEVYKYMCAMDLFVFPSIYEGLGVALIEAQASGLTCVASTAVPKEVNLTDCITYISLERPKEWLSYINTFKPLSAEKRIEKSLANIKTLTEKGYEIRTEAKKLSDIYKS